MKMRLKLAYTKWRSCYSSFSVSGQLSTAYHQSSILTHTKGSIKEVDKSKCVHPLKYQCLKWYLPYSFELLHFCDLLWLTDSSYIVRCALDMHEYSHHAVERRKTMCDILATLAASCKIPNWRRLPEVHLYCGKKHSWWRHQMETLSALLALCAGNSPVTGEFPAQRASNAELWCFLWSEPEQIVE